MRRLTFVAAVCALGTSAVARAQEPVDPATIAQIKTEAMQHSQVGELFNHLANAIGPRLTNSPAFRQAVEWCVAQLKQAGLANVHTEPWPFGRGWALEQLTLEITAPQYFPLIGYAEGWTPSTSGPLTGTPVYVGDLTADQIRARKAALAGKIVLPWKPQTAFITQDRPQPTEHAGPVRIGAPPYAPMEGPVDRRAMPALMREIGAGAVLQPSQGDDGTVFVLGNRHTPDDAAPTVVLAAEHYNRIVRMLQAGVPVTLRVNVQTRYYAADTSASNVIAELPGTDPTIGDQVVMLGAHLDSWHAGTGATDNADGVATLIEAARILKTLGVRPRRTIRFALWGGEEEGLLGSRAYVAQHLAGDANAAARAQFDVYFNNDPGTGPTYGWYLEENAAVKPIFDAWLAPLTDIGARRNVIEKIGSTDHLSFIAVGLPGFNTIQDYTHYDTRTHHTNMDVYERVNVDDLKEVAALLATFAYEAAMRDAMVPRAPGATP
jgi:carboxypeptidase Q